MAALYTTQAIALPLNRKGDTVTVKAHVYKDTGLCYHPYLLAGTASDPVWSEILYTVTHVASGLALLTATRGKAQRAIRLLTATDIDWTQPLSALTDDVQLYRRAKDVVREVKDSL